MLNKDLIWEDQDWSSTLYVIDADSRLVGIAARVVRRGLKDARFDIFHGQEAGPAIAEGLEDMQSAKRRLEELLDSGEFQYKGLLDGN